jgi:hypothetical protein
MTKETITLGYTKGETCNRNGCGGIIDEHPKKGSCSCHINPPCGYCTTDTSYCPECHWYPELYITPVDPEVQKRNTEYYARENQRWQEQRNSFYRKFNGQEPITKLEIRGEPHTHFSQIKVGVFPPNSETTESLLPEIKGTFGGRFTRFEPAFGRFHYIAYTD